MSQPPKKTGMSLYENLLNPNKNAGTISSAPVKYDVKQQEADLAAQQKKKDASLQFQPVNRPQQKQKAKLKSASSSSAHKFSSSTVSASAGSPEQYTSSTPQQPPIVQPKSTFGEWIENEEEDWQYFQPAVQKHERGGRKKKKHQKREEQTYTWSWNDVYDPTRPTILSDYKGSDEQFDEREDWYKRLHYHKNKKEGKDRDAYSDEEDEPVRLRDSRFGRVPPPSNPNFAPPSFDNALPAQSMDVDSDDYYRPPSNDRRSSDAHSLPADATGEDAYMARMRMSSTGANQSSSPAPSFAPSAPIAATVSKQPSEQMSEADKKAKQAEAMEKIAKMKIRMAQKKAEREAAAAAATVTVTTDTALSVQAAVPVQANPIDPLAPPPPPPTQEGPGATISRAPVRYELPAASPDFPADEDSMMAESGNEGSTPEAADEPRSKRPGQKGFAQRMMEKQGWKKGEGLGAKGDGITTALLGKLNKKSGLGKTVGGKRRKLEEDEDDHRFGTISEVIKLEGMLNGLDVQREIEDNNLLQQIGDQMNANYGRVERLYVWRKDLGGNDEVFVKFTNQMGALKAVNATHGMKFAENENVVARFFDLDRFESGDYA